MMESETSLVDKRRSNESHDEGETEVSFVDKTLARAASSPEETLQPESKRLKLIDQTSFARRCDSILIDDSELASAMALASLANFTRSMNPNASNATLVDPDQTIEEQFTDNTIKVLHNQQQQQDGQADHNEGHSQPKKESLSAEHQSLHTRTESNISSASYVSTEQRQDDYIGLSLEGEDGPAPVTPEKTCALAHQQQHMAQPQLQHQQRRVHFAPDALNEEQRQKSNRRNQIIQRLQLPPSNSMPPAPASPHQVHHVYRHYTVPTSPNHHHHLRSTYSFPHYLVTNPGQSIRVVETSPRAFPGSPARQFNMPHMLAVTSSPPMSPRQHPHSSWLPPATVSESNLPSMNVAGTDNNAAASNTWVCDFCHLGSFATYQEACRHEETCSARHGQENQQGDLQPSTALTAGTSTTKARLTATPPSSVLIPILRPTVSLSPKGGSAIFAKPPRARAPQHPSSPSTAVSSSYSSSSLRHSPESGAFSLLTPQSPSSESPWQQQSRCKAQQSKSPPSQYSSTSKSQSWHSGFTALSIGSKDAEWLPPLQCFIRLHCVKAFSAQQTDVDMVSPRRIGLNQVGIRCCFCTDQRGDYDNNSTPDAARFISFPASLSGIYEVVHKWYDHHAPICSAMPDHIRKELFSLALAEQQEKGVESRDVTTTVTLGNEDSSDIGTEARSIFVESAFAPKSTTSNQVSLRQYWVDSAKALGMVDTLDGIRFSKDVFKFSITPPDVEALSANMKFLNQGSLSTSGGLPALSSDHIDNNSIVHKYIPLKAATGRVGGESTDESTSSPLISSREGASDQGGDYIVDPEDASIIPPYVHFLMRQVESCRFTEADRFVARSKGPIGYPGFQCRHCHGQAGLGKYFPVSSKSLSTNSTSQNIHAHLLKCRQCPVPVKSQLVALKEEKAKAPRLEPGWRKVFFDKIWFRLHGTEPDNVL